SDLVMDDQRVVTRAAPVELDHVGSEPPGLDERLDRVLTAHRGCAAMGDDGRRGAHRRAPRRRRPHDVNAARRTANDRSDDQGAYGAIVIEASDSSTMS